MKMSRVALADACPLSLRRVLLTLLILPVLLGASYCERKLPVPVPLPVAATLPAANLLAQINNQASVETLTARATLDFTDYAQASRGTKREIPTANGLLVLKRPQQIRLLVEAPVFGIKVADMVSNGQDFKVAIYWPQASRKFLLGSNLREYGKVEGEEKNTNPDLQRAGALANIRPQHLTDAVLLSPVEERANQIYFVEEATEIEADQRPNRKRGAQVERPYYILSLLERDTSGVAQLTRRFWFDRSQAGAPLTRRQIFERGVPVTEISYLDFFELNGRRLPKRTHIRRRNDLYAVTITLKPETVQLNTELPETAFILTNEEGLPEINLDTRLKAGAQPDKP